MTSLFPTFLLRVYFAAQCFHFLFESIFRWAIFITRCVSFFQMHNNNLSLSFLTRHLTMACVTLIRFTLFIAPHCFWYSWIQWVNFIQKHFFWNFNSSKKTAMDYNCFVNRVKWKCEKCGISNICGFSEPYKCNRSFYGEINRIEKFRQINKLKIEYSI